MSYFLTPISANKLNLCNRLVMPPMATAKAKADGKITSEQISYYGEKSKGGYISLVIIEHSFITLQGKASEKQLSIADDSVIDSLKELADLLHKNGSKAAMQLNHAGGVADKNTGMDIVGPSAVPHPLNNTIPLALTKEQINTIVQE